VLTGLLSHLVALTPMGKSLRAVRDCSKRAEHFRQEGHLEEALAAGREGLALLRSQGKWRGGAAEDTSLLALTVFVEEVAAEIGCTGADDGDILESVEKLKHWDEALVRFPDLATQEPESVRTTRAKWSAFLQERLKARRRTSGWS
jgi:hypothetical protein